MTTRKRGARGAWIAPALGVLIAAAAAAQEPRTRAERTSYAETSRYDDVVAFLHALDPARVHLTSFGYSLEGRSLPLAVVGAPAADAEAVRATGKTRVFIQANIHGGEVEGKEAAQMLLRALAEGQHARLLDSLVILVAPIYNADGNERVRVTNRARQYGPFGGVGQRENAQGLDLNRDHMKLESPEARALVGLFSRYDPHVVVDLHTTNGTTHAYHLTYSPPLHPSTDERVVRLLRDRWLPASTDGLRTSLGWHAFYYGNAGPTPDGGRAWYTFDHRPRFNNNYVGLRNRFAILSEAYSYASFEDRVRATLAFVHEVLDFAHAHATRIRRITEGADQERLVGRELPLRAEFAAGPEIEILMGEVEDRLSPISGRRYLARRDVVRPVRMRDYSTFRGTETERVPDAYYVPAQLTAVIDLLTLHGVMMTPLTRAERLRLERFAIDSTRTAEREFQGHREREVFGAWRPAEVELPAGTMVVPLDAASQPLARLVFHLLEPRSDDGFLNWNVLDRVLEREPGAYPIVRARATLR